MNGIPEYRQSLLTFVDGAELMHVTVGADEISYITKDLKVVCCAIMSEERQMFNNYIDLALKDLIYKTLPDNRTLTPFDGTLICTLMGGARLYRGFDKSQEMCSFLLTSTGQEIDAGPTKRNEFLMLNRYLREAIVRYKYLQ